MNECRVDIRLAVEADLNVLGALSRETFIAAFGPHNKNEDMDEYIGKCLSNHKLLEELQQTENRFFLLYTGNTVAGYIKIRPGFEPQFIAEMPALEIERLYIHPDFQNLGLGRIMIEHCIRIAKNEQYKTLWLGVWEHNLNAIRFYERLDFIHFGSHKFLLGNDLQTDILMKRPV